MAEWGIGGSSCARVPFPVDEDLSPCQKRWGSCWKRWVVLHSLIGRKLCLLVLSLHCNPTQTIVSRRTQLLCVPACAPAPTSGPGVIRETLSGWRPVGLRNWLMWWVLRGPKPSRVGRGGLGRLGQSLNCSFQPLEDSPSPLALQSLTPQTAGGGGGTFCCSPCPPTFPWVLSLQLRPVSRVSLLCSLLPGECGHVTALHVECGCHGQGLVFLDVGRMDWHV